MPMKKFSIAAVSLAVLLLASCASDDVQTPADTTAADTTPITETADNRPAFTPDELDFGGAPYRICIFGSTDRLAPETLTGEAVNDITYERNKNLAEKYHFTLEASAIADYVEHTRHISSTILAGEDAYELVVGHVVTHCNNAVNNLFLDLYTVPYIDFSDPWYPAQSVEQMTVYDRMYTICTAMTYEQLNDAKVLVFNKDLLAATDTAEPYDWVRDGTWTMERLFDQTKGMYRDINGDGKRGTEDQYGFATHPYQNGFLVSCDTQVLAKTTDGGYEIAVMNPRMESLVSMLYSWYYESGDVYLGESTDEPNGPYAVFMNGNTAYAFSQLSRVAGTYRDSNIRYGIAPMPKFDEHQEEYYVFACPSQMSIPITCANTELAGFAFDAMTYYGYYDVVPAYFEKTLQGKAADSPDDMEMLSVINENLTVSFAYCYDNWEGFAHLLGSRMGFTVTSGQNNLASVYTKNEKKAQKRLDKVLEAFRADLG